MAKIWTEKEIRRLKKLTRAGFTDKVISRKITEEFGYKRSKSAVKNKRLDLGLTKEELEEERFVFPAREIEEAISGQEGDNWSKKDILALNYLTSRDVSDDSIARLINKKPAEIKNKRKELNEQIKHTG